MIFLLELAAGTLLAGALTYLVLTVTPQNITCCEKLCRNKIAGLVIALPSLLLCVPLAQPVSPSFLLPLLYPIAVIFPILCFFQIDFYAARSYAFFMILLAYEIIHGAFVNRIAAAPLLTIAALMMGSGGIWLSAQPCLLREIFRKCANSKKWKYSTVAVTILMALLSFYTLVMMIIGVYSK